MSMADGTEQVTEASGTEPQGQTQGTESQEASGGNPNWEAFRTQVGDTTFALMKPHLTEWDKQAQQRITAANADRDRYTSLGSYDDLSTYATVAQQLDADPAGFYRNLGQMLAERGVDLSELTPQQQAAVIEDALDDGDEDDPTAQRIRQLEEFQQNWIAEQEAAQQEQQVGQWQGQWEQSFAAAKSANSWLADEDDQALRALAAPLFTDEDEIPVTFQKALASLIDIRNRTLSAPRAGNSAPRLIPSGGGNPAIAEQQDVSKLGRRETVDLVAQMLRNNQS